MKTINDSNPGVKRPLRVSDLQAIWDGMAEMFKGEAISTPRILSGFNLKSDGTLSAGVIVFNGKLYFHSDTGANVINFGDSVYYKQLNNVDLRVFEDSTTQNFSYDNVLTTTVIAGQLVGTFDAVGIANMKILPRYRVVTGVVTVLPTVVPSVEFVPDNPADTDILPSVAYVSGELDRFLYLRFEDGNSNKALSSSSLHPKDSLSWYNLSYPQVRIYADSEYNSVLYNFKVMHEAELLIVGYGLPFAVTLYFPLFSDVAPV